MHFNLIKHHTAGITYKDDGQVPKSKIKNGKIVNSNITFKKPFKLQIRASKMMDGKKTIRKKTITYPITSTLLDAIKAANKTYNGMMVDIENDIVKETTNLHSAMKFSEAFKAYVDYKEAEYKNSSTKTTYNSKGAYSFYKKYLTSIHNKPLNRITPVDITTLKSKMVGKTDRTKLAVHQWINPIYNFIGDNTPDIIKSPAKIKKSDRDFDNTRTLPLSNNEIKALFKKLRDYPVSPYREVFMWLMHGRRRNEVLSLQWSDIDLENSTYTIRTVNNKARIDMTYKLTDRLKDTLEVQAGLNDLEEMTGYIFRGVRDNTKSLHELRMRKHWLDLKEPIVMHQLRSCIVTYLKNVHNVSNEISGYILGHIQANTVTERYGTFGYEVLSNSLDLMLDDVFDDVNPLDDKLKQLQALFPNKTKEQLEVFLNDI